MKTCVSDGVLFYRRIEEAIIGICATNVDYTLHDANRD